MLRFILNSFAWCFLWITYWTGRFAFQFKVCRAKCRDGNIRILRGWMPEHEEEFPQQVQMALRWIDETDPRRAKMVRANIRIIADTPVMSSLGIYLHDRKLCCINYDALRTDCVGAYPLDERVQRVLTMELATLLIHEATHGRLLSRGIAYTDETWEQSERVCRAQEVHFLSRVCGDWIDLRGRPVDWSQMHAMESVKDVYLASREQSYWDQLSYRFRAAWEAASRITDEEAEQRVSIHEATAASRVVSTWSQQFQAYPFFRNRSPMTPATLETSAHAFQRSGLPIAAAECYGAIQSQGWKMPWLERYWYGKTLFMLRRFDDATEVFATIEGEENDNADCMRLQQAYCLRCLDRFEEAQELFSTIQLKSIVDTQCWYHLQTAMLQNDALGCFDVLQEICSDTEPEDIKEDGFYAHALRPFVAWLTGHDSDYESALQDVIAARERWLTENAERVEPRRGIVVSVDPSLHRLEANVDDAVVLVRTDRDLSDDQLAGGRAFAGTMKETAKHATTTSSEAVLQGLYYGNDDFTVRDIDWDTLDPACRLEGTWHVVDLPIDRIFLEHGRLEGDLLNLWMKAGEDAPEFVLRGDFDPATPRTETGFPQMETACPQHSAQPL